jgi:hypothetical protein
VHDFEGLFDSVNVQIIAFMEKRGALQRCESIALVETWDGCMVQFAAQEGRLYNHYRFSRAIKSLKFLKLTKPRSPNSKITITNHLLK